MVLETPIDRKVDGGEDGADEGGASEEEQGEQEQPPKKTKKGKGKGNAPRKPAKEKTVEDKGIWAREIKLLESLIGMDVHGTEFKELEAKLAKHGAEERQKYQEAFDRKVAKEEKAKTKDIRTFFGKGTAEAKAKGAGTAKKDDGSGSESSLSELADEPS